MSELDHLHELQRQYGQSCCEVVTLPCFHHRSFHVWRSAWAQTPLMQMRFQGGQSRTRKGCEEFFGGLVQSDCFDCRLLFCVATVFQDEKSSIHPQPMCSGNFQARHNLCTVEPR